MVVRATGKTREAATGGASREAATGADLDLSPRDLGLPFDRYRVGQGELSLDVAADDKRFSLVSAPTGAGKSLIYASVAKLLGGRALVLTGTKGLQEQLITDFGAAGMEDIRSHLNYPCAGDTRFSGNGMGPRGLLKPESSMPSEGVCQGQVNQLTGARDCDYIRAVRLARASDLVVTNYAYWLMRERSNEPDLLGRFDLLILDEAHTADGWLSKTCVWRETDARAEELEVTLPREASEKVWVNWARANCERFPRLKEVVRASEMGVEWVVARDLGKVELTPAWGRPWAEQCLFRGVDRVVLTSATLSPDTGKYLGVPEGESTYWEAGSPFSYRRRPVIFMTGSTRVQYKMEEGERRQWMNKVDAVIDERVKLGRKGIVHTVSYRRAEEVFNRSRHKGIMVHHRAGEVKAAVRDFKRAKGPVVLVSPSVTEGYDFPDDECRWQIIVKVPFIKVKGEPVVQARQRSDKEFANYLAAQAVVQMSGRAVRGPADWAETIIVDGHWAWFRKSVRWPGWFKRAMKSSGLTGGGKAMTEGGK